ncbi:hypothetical protein CMUST_10280 [Corynebacterium mustelae]|uniref:Uncharacterized protein n=2 Tax=Corynebacterium mustelae TaxID=571915 RepID=A0A0G3H5F9_9CORY|nr:hypothetical protein CMUST_10280 [Corynebacterium mustelae]
MKNRYIAAAMLSLAVATSQAIPAAAQPPAAIAQTGAEAPVVSPANPAMPEEKENKTPDGNTSPKPQPENPGQGSSEKDQMIAKGVGIFAAVMVVIAGIVALIRKLGIRSPF